MLNEALLAYGKNFGTTGEIFWSNSLNVSILKKGFANSILKFI
jgi:hypothetical protein